MLSAFDKLLVQQVAAISSYNMTFSDMEAIQACHTREMALAS